MRPILRTRHAAAPVAVLVVFLAGCGSADRVGVSGKVTLNGQPLTNATIQFFPQGAMSPAGGTVVTDGKYELPAKPGLPPGKYKVSISSPVGGETATGSFVANPGAKGKTVAPQTTVKDLVPAKYNTNTELQVEVTAKGPNTFDFDLR